MHIIITAILISLIETIVSVACYRQGYSKGHDDGFHICSLLYLYKHENALTEMKETYAELYPDEFDK